MKRYFLFFLFLSGMQLTLAQKEITLDDIWNSSDLRAASAQGVRFYEGSYYTQVENNAIYAYDVKTGKKVKTVFDPSSDEKFGSFEVTSFAFKNDNEDILFTSNVQSIYRYSFLANYHLYDKSENELIKIGKEGEKVMVADVSPNTQFASYVKDNNIYIQNLKTGTFTQVTHDGKVNEVINGSSDWVYEEELTLTQSYEWSNNGKYIAFLKFDESEVPEFRMEYYTGDEYPEEYTFKYPKVGEKNSVVTLHLYDVEKNKVHNIDIDGYYLARLQWSPKGNILVSTLNRHQNHLVIYEVNPSTKHVAKFLEEENDAYIDIHGRINFIDDEKFIWESEKDGWNHVYIYENGKEVEDLTPGEYDVTSVYGYDKKSGKIYFQAAMQAPMYRGVYSVDKKKKMQTLHEGKSIYDASFSEDFSAYILNKSRINFPTITSVYDIKGKLLRVLEDNKAYEEVLKKYGANPVEFFDFTTEYDVTLHGWMIKPNNFDPSKKYPIFMYLYGGPNSQQVLDSWKGAFYWWFQMLADKGYIIACVDNRGTGARGEAFRKMTYMQLGKYETEDQIAAAKYLGELPYGDPSRIGIFGWSYGGFMATNAILKGNEVFSLGIAVAPVTNWKWYDSIYTERYMRTDDENPSGYEDNSPVNYAHLLEGDYLLIHGMADDNVHFQHAVEMANALISAGKQFDTYFYPNRNHSISGDGVREHLFQKMTDFIVEKL